MSKIIFTLIKDVSVDAMSLFLSITSALSVAAPRHMVGGGGGGIIPNVGRNSTNLQISEGKPEPMIKVIQNGKDKGVFTKYIPSYILSLQSRNTFRNFTVVYYSHRLRK